MLRVLVDAYPEGKTVQDKRYRTPLHFAFFRKDAKEDKNLGGAITNKAGINQDDVGNSMTEIVKLLSDSGAAEVQDEGGMVRRREFLICEVAFWTQSFQISSSYKASHALRRGIRHNPRGP